LDEKLKRENFNESSWSRFEGYPSPSYKQISPFACIDAKLDVKLLNTLFGDHNNTIAQQTATWQFEVVCQYFENFFPYSTIS
jgi:hypothetical protein